MIPDVFRSLESISLLSGMGAMGGGKFHHPRICLRVFLQNHLDTRERDYSVSVRFE